MRVPEQKCHKFVKNVQHNDTLTDSYLVTFRRGALSPQKYGNIVTIKSMDRWTDDGIIDEISRRIAISHGSETNLLRMTICPLTFFDIRIWIWKNESNWAVDTSISSTCYNNNEKQGLLKN